MSVYSGFCTRALENEYNTCILSLIALLAKRCVIALTTQPLSQDTKFAGNLGKLYGQIKKLEECKYSNPKYSIALKELSDQIGIISYKSTIVEQPNRRKMTLQNVNQQLQSIHVSTPAKRQPPTSYVRSNRLKTEENTYHKSIEKSLRYRELEFLCQFD